MASTSSAPFSLPKANANFFLALFKELQAEDKTANVFHSPLSISAGLAMVLLGTCSNTAKQISEVLCFSKSEEPKMETEEITTTMRSPMSSLIQTRMQTRMQLQTQLKKDCKLPGYLLKCIKPQAGEADVEVHKEFSKLLNSLNTDAGDALSIANRLYAEKTYKFIEHFLNETKTHYKAGFQTVEFSEKPKEALDMINEWVEEQTAGKIKNLMTPDLVDGQTKLVLVNAIYFKGKWSEKFKEEDTTDAQFRVNKNDTKPVKMMRMKTKFALREIEDSKIKILEMPYEGNHLSMIIILPDDIEDDTTGLEKLEKELTYDKFEEWTQPDNMPQTEVEVKLPRFKMEAKYNLKDILKRMGMVDAFDVSKSNFTGMSEANDLVLSSVVHKANVEVTEEGTEASAATAAVVSERSLIIPVSFNGDHPFLFFIRHNASKSVLFAGRFCSPE